MVRNPVDQPLVTDGETQERYNERAARRPWV